MSKTGGQTTRLLYLRDILLKYTDEDHLLTRSELEARLKNDFDIEVDRKTFSSNLTDLDMYLCSANGMPEELPGQDYYYIICDKSKKEHRYGARDCMRVFTPAELKILAGAIETCKFITQEQSQDFIDKLGKLCSDHARMLNRENTILRDRVKTRQNNVFDIIDKLNQAILEKKQVRFHYFNWDHNKNKAYRRKDWYVVNPWNLTWDDGKYYLIGDDRDSKERNVRHYRIDKIDDDIEILDVRCDFSNAFQGLSPAVYCKSLFGMYGGDELEIKLVCHDSMAGVILDRFGMNMMLHREDNEHFYVHVKVQNSDLFYGWIIGLGNKVRIAGPNEAIERVHAIMNRLREQYP